MKKLSRVTTEANAASMADIAFLLLIFFMVTTTIVNDKGLDLLLPPHRLDTPEQEIHDRNLFTILINSHDKLLVEEEPRESYQGLREDIRTFIMNNGFDKTQSDDPQSAIVSIKANRGTTQNMFIKILDEAKAAYYEIYGEKLGISPEGVRSLDLNDPDIKKKYRALKAEIPMNISIAEPD